jgi:hypothetical protein
MTLSQLNVCPAALVAGFPTHPQAADSPPVGHHAACRGPIPFRDSSGRRAILREQAAEPTAAPGYEVSNQSLVPFDCGDENSVRAGDAGMRFLLVSVATDVTVVVLKDTGHWVLEERLGTPLKRCKNYCDVSSATQKQTGGCPNLGHMIMNL